MKIRRKIVYIGQTHWVSIPIQLVRQLGIKKGDTVSVVGDGRVITVVPAMKQAFGFACGNKVTQI